MHIHTYVIFLCMYIHMPTWDVGGHPPHEDSGDLLSRVDVGAVLQKQLGRGHRPSVPAREEGHRVQRPEACF